MDFLRAVNSIYSKGGKTQADETMSKGSHLRNCFSSIQFCKVVLRRGVTLRRYLHLC